MKEQGRGCRVRTLAQAPLVVDITLAKRAEALEREKEKKKRAECGRWAEILEMEWGNGR